MRLSFFLGYQHDFFYLSTDKGTVQKVIVLPKDDLQTEELVLEEVEVFKVRETQNWSERTSTV